MSRLLRSVATVVLLAAAASASCPTLTTSDNQQVPLNQMKPIVLTIGQVFGNPPQTNQYVWSFDLCNGNAANPTGASKPCGTAGYVMEFSKTALSCEQTFTNNPTPWAWNGSAANAVFTTASGYIMNVGVVCSEQADLAALWPTYASQGGSGIVSWGMQLSSKAACPRGGSTPPTPNPGTSSPGSSPSPPWTYSPGDYVVTVTATAACSGGCAFVIIVFVGLFVYVVVAILWNYFRLGKRGRELAPHPAFWTSLPGLVKDGFVFTFTKLRGLCQRGGGSTAGGYAQV